MTIKTIGIVLSRRKLQESSLEGLIDRAIDSSFRFVLLDLNQPLTSQPKIDGIIHKITDVYAAMKRNDAQGIEHFGRFEALCQSQPDMVLIDPWDRVKQLMDRWSLYQILAHQTRDNTCLFSVPVTAVLDSFSPDALERLPVPFPIFVKRRAACSSVGTHQMTVCPTRKGARQLKTYSRHESVVVQQFIQHDGVLVKVYVAHRKIYVFTRPSIRNVTDNTAVIHFDSQTMPKQFETDTDTTVTHSPFQTSRQAADIVEQQLDYKRLESIANTLSKKLGLTLFGYDVVVESGTGTYYIVDVNYFPSFQNVPQFSNTLVEIIKERL